MNKNENLKGYKTGQTHTVSNFKKTLRSLQDSPASIKKLSQVVKYLKGKLQKILGAIKR